MDHPARRRRRPDDGGDADAKYSTCRTAKGEKMRGKIGKGRKEEWKSGRVEEKKPPVSSRPFMLLTLLLWISAGSPAMAEQEQQVFAAAPDTHLESASDSYYQISFKRYTS